MVSRLSPGDSTVRKRVLAAIPDLFFGSKVTGAAAKLGIHVQVAVTRQAVLAAALSKPDLVIVDLDAPAVDAIGLIGELRSGSGVRPPRVVAFASHVRDDLLAAARAAGYDQVLTRGALAAALPQLLASL